MMVLYDSLRYPLAPTVPVYVTVLPTSFNNERARLNVGSRPPARIASEPSRAAPTLPSTGAARKSTARLSAAASSVSYIAGESVDISITSSAARAAGIIWSNVTSRAASSPHRLMIVASTLSTRASSELSCVAPRSTRTPAGSGIRSKRKRDSRAQEGSAQLRSPFFLDQQHRRASSWQKLLFHHSLDLALCIRVERKIEDFRGRYFSGVSFVLRY